MIRLSIDVGGSATKGAPVDVETGEFLEDRYKVETRKKPRPCDVVAAVKEIVEHFRWTGPIGITYPGVVMQGVIYTAANVHSSWIDLDGQAMFEKETGLPVELLNDADAAALAEMQFGAGRGQGGTVLLLTLGTGIGTALMGDGVLLRNTEFGHIKIRGLDAEKRAAAGVRESKSLTMAQWAKRLEEYLQEIEKLCWPRLIIIGGGISRRSEEFLPLIKGVKAQIVPAELFNDAGIVGAGLALEAAMAPRGL